MEAHPRISFCMIVKNEEKHLARCLDSVKFLVDEMVIVDTGSQDATVDIAKKHGARVHFFDWTDSFAAARNESLRHATGDWIFYLDADERLNAMGEEDCLRKAASAGGADAYVVPIRNHKKSSGHSDPDMSHNIRLFRRIPGIHFVNEVHERIEPFLEQAGATVGRSTFLIEHLGYIQEDSDKHLKLERNLALSRSHLKREPRDAYALFYMGVTLLELERNLESRQTLEKALQGKGLTPMLEAIILNLLAYHHLKEGQYDLAMARAKASLSAIPRQGTAGLLLGLIHYQLRRFDLALDHLTRSHRVLQLPPEKRQSDLGQEHFLVNGADLLKAIAICHSERQEYALAIPYLRSCLEDHSEEPEIVRLLGLCYLNTADFPSAARCLTRARELGMDGSLLSMPLAYAYFQMGEAGEAARCLLEAGADRPEDEAAALKLLELMANRTEYAASYGQILARKKALLQRTDIEKLSGLTNALAASGQHGPLLELCRWIGLRSERGESLLASIAGSHFERNQIPELILLLERLSAAYPDHPRVLDILGIAYIKAGDFRKAIDAHLAIERLTPENSEICRRLAGLFLKVDDIESARQWLMKAQR